MSVIHLIILYFCWGYSLECWMTQLRGAAWFVSTWVSFGPVVIKSTDKLKCTPLSGGLVGRYERCSVDCACSSISWHILTYQAHMLCRIMLFWQQLLGCTERAAFHRKWCAAYAHLRQNSSSGAEYKVKSVKQRKKAPCTYLAPSITSSECGYVA